METRLSRLMGKDKEEIVELLRAAGLSGYGDRSVLRVLSRRSMLSVSVPSGNIGAISEYGLMRRRTAARDWSG